MSIILKGNQWINEITIADWRYINQYPRTTNNNLKAYSNISKYTGYTDGDEQLVMESLLNTIVPKNVLTPLFNFNVEFGIWSIINGNSTVYDAQDNLHDSYNPSITKKTFQCGISINTNISKFEYTPINGTLITQTPLDKSLIPLDFGNRALAVKSIIVPDNISLQSTENSINILAAQNIHFSCSNTLTIDAGTFNMGNK